MEIGDMAAWAGLAFAVASFLWHVVNEWRARRAARLASLAAQTRRQGAAVLVLLINQDARRHTEVACRVQLRAPDGATMALATAYDAKALDQLEPFGTRSRKLDLIFMPVDKTGTDSQVRLFVLGLPSPDSPFTLDVTVLEKSSGRLILRRRDWTMMGRRH